MSKFLPFSLTISYVFVFKIFLEISSSLLFTFHIMNYPILSVSKYPFPKDTSSFIIFDWGRYHLSLTISKAY